MGTSQAAHDMEQHVDAALDKLLRLSLPPDTSTLSPSETPTNASSSAPEDLLAWNADETLRPASELDDIPSNTVQESPQNVHGKNAAFDGDYHKCLGSLKALHDQLDQRPYSVTLRLSIADAYQQLFYPDLAAGEAYKALLLVDEICNESSEYHERALEAAMESTRAWKPSKEAVDDDDESATALREETVRLTETNYSKAAYLSLVRNLTACGCLRSACEICVSMLKKHPDLQKHNVARDALAKLFVRCNQEGVPFELEKSIKEAPDAGTARRELYPWNEHEPDRFSEEALGLLNHWLQEAAPKLEVKATVLPILSTSNSMISGTMRQLGIFAKEDIQPGEIALQETSPLTATSRLHEAFCDACSAKLPTTQAENTADVRDVGADPMSCEECQETVFCSQACYDLAQELYHPAICGNNVSAIAQDVPAAEAADALYSLLLLRSFAMAETQDVHPLRLKEVKYIWGDYQTIEIAEGFNPESRDPHGGYRRTLPFSFKYNILIPLNMLEKMDVNIFEDGGRYSTWVFNTLYAKFRGTASARQGPDRKPEVGAVHPLWCLANHSCDPNVTWEWEGKMRLWVKDERAHWKGKRESFRTPAGVKKGEEIMNHYCDVSLDVNNRREWAAGALGGLCQCERCRWEEKV